MQTIFEITSYVVTIVWPDQDLNIQTGGDESFFSKLNKKIYEANGLGKEEIERLEKEAEEDLKNLGIL